MEFQAMYQEKLASAEQAAAIVKSGDWVDFGWAVTTPVALDKALAARMDGLYDVKFRGGIVMWPLEIFKTENAAEHFCWNSWHMSGVERKMIASGVAYYNALRYSELPRYYREHCDPVDVAMFQVSPMDEHGWFNFGPSASHMRAVCDRSRAIVVEVNENMPRCLGGMETGVHISEVAMVVEGATRRSDRWARRRRPRSTKRLRG